MLGGVERKSGSRLVVLEVAFTKLASHSLRVVHLALAEKHRELPQPLQSDSGAKPTSEAASRLTFSRDGESVNEAKRM